MCQLRGIKAIIFQLCYAQRRNTGSPRLQGHARAWKPCKCTRAQRCLAPAALPPSCGTKRAGAVRRGADRSGGAGGPHPALHLSSKHRGASHPQGRHWGTRTCLRATHHSRVWYQAPACKNPIRALSYFSDRSCECCLLWGGSHCLMLHLVWTVKLAHRT